MNCYNILLLTLLSLLNTEKVSMVTFQKEQVTVTQEEDTRVIVLPFEIKKGYHIQSDKPDANDMIVTEIIIERDDRFQILSNSFDGSYSTLQLGEDNLNIIIDKFEVTVTIKCPKEIKDGLLKGKLLFQACDDRKCYFPRELEIEISI